VVQDTLKRDPIRALFLLLTCRFALTSVAQASVYYVAKTGSDSNSGSASAPWLTIGHAALEAKAGDTVFVGNGTYNESVLFANSGTSSAPRSTQRSTEENLNDPGSKLSRTLLCAAL
jgi:hypothetical protein